MEKTVDDYVLAQLERLSNPNLNGKELEKELQRSDATSKLAKVFIDNKEADIKSRQVDVQKDLIKAQYGPRPQNAPKLLSGGQYD